MRFNLINIAKNYILTIPKPSYIPAIFWVILTTVLLILPASKFPTEGWFDKIWLDKWVHIGLFAAMVTLWCWASLKNRKDKSQVKKIFIAFTIIWFLYGTGMEFVQKYFVPNRSFDPGDIIADGVGCIIGLWFSLRILLKKLTPVETGVATKTNCL